MIIWPSRSGGPCWPKRSSAGLGRGVLSKCAADSRPLGFQHAPNHQVHPPAAYPLRLTRNTLAGEAEPFGYGAALGVSRSAADLDAVKRYIAEQVLEHRAAAAGHNSLLLPRLVDPV